MAHTSTLPNYPILASLDRGRRQAALEGFELVQRQLEYAMKLLNAIDHHPLLSKHTHGLSTAEMIPERDRASGIRPAAAYRAGQYGHGLGAGRVRPDPFRVTVSVGLTGIDGRRSNANG
jgi:arginine decarboxylase